MNILGNESDTIKEEIYEKINVINENLIFLSKKINSENFWRNVCLKFFNFSENSMFNYNRKMNSRKKYKERFFEFYLEKCVNKVDLDFEQLMAIGSSVGELIIDFKVK